MNQRVAEMSHTPPACKNSTHGFRPGAATPGRIAGVLANSRCAFRQASARSRAVDGVVHAVHERLPTGVDDVLADPNRDDGFAAEYVFD